MLISHVLRCRDCRNRYFGRVPDLRTQLAALDARAAAGPPATPSRSGRWRTEPA